MRFIAGLCLPLSALAGCGVDVHALIDRDAGANPPDAAMGAAIAVVAGQTHTCALRGASLFCWGANTFGQLGVADQNDRGMPVRAAADRDWDTVAVGERFTCARQAVTADVYCWGHSQRGETGVRVAAGLYRSARIALPQPARSLIAGFSHACAIVQDGSLWCWGDNAEGQLGQGNRTLPDTDVPVQVQTARDWMGAAGAQGSMCGLRAPGIVWCWGRNTGGQLGQGPGAPGQIRSPMRAGSFEDWRTLSAAQDSVCALRADDSLWCWGSGDNVGNSTVPTQIGSASLSMWRLISVGTFSTCGLRRDDSLWCWGRNSEGALGLGDNSSRSSPTRVGIGQWRGLSMGRFHSCAIDPSGAILCTGKNEFGEVGTGRGAKVLTPVTLP